VRNLLTLNAASAWLKAGGYRPSSRPMLAIAIARRQLRARELAPRVTLIRLEDLERYAAERCTNDKAAKSA
jgi:hypothetical protein